MKVKLCDINAAAVEKLPGKMDDKSGIGVHYVDAYLKPMNAKLPDGTQIKCKRRGLKIVHMRLFAELADSGQVSAAASALAITQPAASRLAAEAEQICGVRLYQRTNRGIALTPAGQAFATRAASTKSLRSG